MSQHTPLHAQPVALIPAEKIGSERRSQDRLPQLSRQFDYACTVAVDSLQITAALESGGITDHIARDHYGSLNVFTVAEELYRRVPRRLPVQLGEQSTNPRWQILRELSHGPLFVLPGLAYPAVAGPLGTEALMLGLVFSTAVGWVWGMGVSWLAYRLIGRGLKEEAARVLLRLSLIGILAVEVGALLLAHLFGVGSGVMLFATSQMAYQMAASILIIYGLEGWLFLALLPSVAANAWYLATGSPPAGFWVAVGGSLAAVILALVAAFAAIRKTPRAKDFRPTLSALDIRGTWPVFAYGALCAALVLLANARNMFASMDLSLSITPLVLSMGVLEWQARRFRERSRRLLRETRRIAEFVVWVRWVLLDSLLTSLVTVFLFSSATALGLSYLGFLSWPGAMMLAAHLMLAGVFFINFILLAQGRYLWVLGSFAGAVLLYLGAGFFLSSALSYLTTTSLLMVAVILALRPSLSQMSHYR